MVEGLNNWREYFRGANSDIFDVIEHAVIVAALDCPKDFESRRDHIAELLFTCRMAKCSGCDRIELSVPYSDSDEERGAKCKTGEFEGAGGSKESKVYVSYGDAEALTNEMEEESQFIGEVLRIKEILDNHQEESDSVLFESLRRLQLMDLSVEVLKVTEIGKSVNGLKRHGSQQITDLVRTLIDGWVGMLDAWMNSTAAIAENTSIESVKTSTIMKEEDKVEEEEDWLDEGLPSPPLDEGAFFAHSIELSQIFDGMDDDGNPHNSGEFKKNRSTSKKPLQEDKGMNEGSRNLQKSIRGGKQQLANDQVKDSNSEQPALPGVKAHKSTSANTGSLRPPKPSIEKKVNDEIKFQQNIEKLRTQKMPLGAPQHQSPRIREQQQDKGSMRKKPLAPLNEKFRSPNELHVKIEATKRKLQERYQEAENAKRQRTIQVMELSDIPKQVAFQNRQMKHVKHNHNRRWENGRR